MHRDTYANPLAAPIEREPISPEPADPRIIRTQAYADGLAAGRAEAIGPTGGIEDVRHLAAMARAQGRVEGINEERVRVEALYRHHARSNCGVGPLSVTAEELAEIARLDREATPGPWAYDEEDDVIETARGSSVAILTRANRPGLTHVKPDGRAIAAYRTAAPRLASDLVAERATSARLADRCLDLGRELEALRDAVRAHEASVRAGPRSRCWDQADLALWAAAKPADG